MDLDTLQSLLGWSLVINSAVYMIWVVAMLSAREWILRLHERLLAVPPDQARPILYQIMAQYKVLIIVLNFAPWLAVLIVNG